MPEKASRVETPKWILTIAGTLFALLAGVFGVGWNASAQNFKVKVVEKETEKISRSFEDHCKLQAVESKEIQNTLTKQTVMIEGIVRKLGSK